jgi:hypothetical protein
VGEGLLSHRGSGMYHLLVLKRDRKLHPNWCELFHLFILFNRAWQVGYNDFKTRGVRFEVESFISGMGPSSELIEDVAEK